MRYLHIREKERERERKREKGGKESKREGKRKWSGITIGRSIDHAH